ncbi:P-protein [Buchnera aphidicola (Cinara piceae)]|uniref:Bifunctional chorismate mutase/prephenate dehydratase n=1 Tax=Buchnera aphidicola (Cinara piceae) TaxID=1660043 RepID=A0A803GCZ2_9GAMM|nr:prephenate dehydratase domain-containing protein [Buchnera aphidicola]VFP88481.1 P-protein [Buchnera aphidicola (Cinara piceae)]
MNTKKKIYLLRNKINYIDKKIIKLLTCRESLSIDIVKNKIYNQFNIQDKNREIELFKNLYRLSKKNKINPIFIEKIFKIIVKNSILIQKKWKKKILNSKKEFRCAYLGPIGSYSSATFNIIAKKNKHILLEDEHIDFQSMIKSFNQKKCQLALLPIENRISGIIPEVYNILKKQEKIHIIQEINISIQHHLFALKNCFFYNIENIYSHIQPFIQCSMFLKKFPEWKRYYFNSTSAAMNQISIENKNTSAVIGNSIGGAYYNLKKIATNISNIKNNITRFILISKKPKKISKTTPSKITILLTLKNSQINKKKILKILKKKHILIIKIILASKIEEKKEKTYLLEIESNIQSEIIHNTLNNIQKYVKCIKILGCYPIENKIIKIY